MECAQLTQATDVERAYRCFSLRDVVTASALVLILASISAGALIGSVLGAFAFQGAFLAVITAVIALIVAELVRYSSVGYPVAEPAPAALPRVVLVNGMLSSWTEGWQPTA
jgi:hypothetical protein